MGKNAKNVSESDAISHVAGYCIGNARHITFERATSFSPALGRA
jgi:2-keto-4-pentenoate hydratase/2-oxohepta-3-ene-1,7-dioic acid hydratase in catechol pathway